MKKLFAVVIILGIFGLIASATAALVVGKKTILNRQNRNQEAIDSIVKGFLEK